MAAKNLTLEEIAVLTGVSRSTVSRVINNQPNVKEEVRERVQKKIEEVGYRPHGAARRLAGDRSYTLSIIIPYDVQAIFTEPFFPAALTGITHQAEQNDYYVMLSMVERSREEDFYHRVVRGQMPDGVIVLSAKADNKIVPRLIEDKVPFVVIGRHLHIPDISYADVDNIGGARTAVRHLLERGRKKIATITGPVSMVAGVDRREGYLSALNEAGIEIRPELIAQGDFTRESGYFAMQQLLPSQPDAVFAASDLMALGAMSAIRTANLRIPDDIAVVGYDDAPVAAYTDPPLTTMRQPSKELGATAVDVLLRLITEGQEQQLSTVLPAELVIRSSSG